MSKNVLLFYVFTLLLENIHSPACNINYSPCRKYSQHLQPYSKQITFIFHLKILREGFCTGNPILVILKSLYLDKSDPIQSFSEQPGQKWARIHHLWKLKTGYTKLDYFHPDHTFLTTGPQAMTWDHDKYIQLSFIVFLFQHLCFKVRFNVYLTFLFWIYTVLS